MTVISLDDLLQVMRELKQDPSLIIDPNASLFELGILDSFGIIAIIPKLEEVFGYHFSEDQLVPENFQSLQAIQALLTNK